MIITVPGPFPVRSKEGRSPQRQDAPKLLLGLLNKNEFAPPSGAVGLRAPRVTCSCIPSLSLTACCIPSSGSASPLRRPRALCPPQRASYTALKQRRRSLLNVGSATVNRGPQHPPDPLLSPWDTSSRPVRNDSPCQPGTPPTATTLLHRQRLLCKRSAIVLPVTPAVATVQRNDSHRLPNLQ